MKKRVEQKPIKLIRLVGGTEIVSFYEAEMDSNYVRLTDPLSIIVDFDRERNDVIIAFYPYVTFSIIEQNVTSVHLNQILHVWEVTPEILDLYVKNVETYNKYFENRKKNGSKLQKKMISPDGTISDDATRKLN